MVAMLAGLNAVLVIGLAVVLMRRFRTTGNSGYLVLAVPLVLWPFIGRLLRSMLQSQIDRRIAGETMSWPLSSFNESTVGEMVAGVAHFVGIIETTLVILGFLWLGHLDRQTRAGAVPARTSVMASATSSPD